MNPANTTPQLRDYQFELPEDLIAQRPLEERDQARLLRLRRRDGALISPEASFCVRDLPEALRPGDLLVMNTTKVLSARLRGRKRSGGVAEALILGPATEPGPNLYQALVRTNGRLREGLELIFEGRGLTCTARIRSIDPEAGVTLQFDREVSPYRMGEAPLPPYIRRETSDAADDARYQTVYAAEPGAVAAPTAGLHFTPALLQDLEAAGIETATVVLHVGIGTFRPLQTRDLERDRLHEEAYKLSPATAEAIDRTRDRGGRVIAVGTTTTRVLETCSTGDGGVAPGQGQTDIFLHPGRPPQVIDGLLTNFHLPGSSLLMLVAGLVGQEALLNAYHHAIQARYRFYSYGDAMLIL